MPALVSSALGDMRNAGAGFPIEPTDDDIARRAYQLYEARGGEHGRDQEDWFQAEQDVRQFLQGAVGKFLTTDSPYATV